MKETGALVYWFDIASAVRSDWLDWYVRDHMPSRVGTAFIAGRCYEAIEATASHMVLFETATPELLLEPSYLKLLGTVSPEDAQRRSWYNNPVRTTARLRAKEGEGTGGVLGVIRITGSQAGHADVGRCLTKDVIPALAAVPKIGAVWVIENDLPIRQKTDQARVTGHKDGPIDWAVFIEAGHAEDITAAFKRLEQLASWRKLGLAEEAVMGHYRLLYTMAQKPV